MSYHFTHVKQLEDNHSVKTVPWRARPWGAVHCVVCAFVFKPFCVLHVCVCALVHSCRCGCCRDKAFLGLKACEKNQPIALPGSEQLQWRGPRRASLITPATTSQVTHYHSPFSAGLRALQVKNHAIIKLFKWPFTRHWPSQGSGRDN